MSVLLRVEGPNPTCPLILEVTHGEPTAIPDDPQVFYRLRLRDTNGAPILTLELDRYGWAIDHAADVRTSDNLPETGRPDAAS